MARRPARRVPTPPAEQKPQNRTAKKLLERLTAAEANVTIAVDDAWRQGRLGDQLWHAVNEWRGRVVRVRQEVVTAARLTGDAQQAALKQLRRRVDTIEDSSERIVESAFTGRLTPDDRLQDVTDRLDALDQAYEDLDGVEPQSTTDRIWSRLEVMRSKLPGRGS